MNNTDSQNQIVVVDCGMGNIGAIENMLRKIGVSCQTTSEPDRIGSASKLILPGVGAFTKGMQKLREFELIEPLNDAVLERGVPVLGICLGMHLLGCGSEEGPGAGLGWIDAKTVRFTFDPDRRGRRLKVPHMGWNTVDPNPNSRLLPPGGREKRFYFVHSYYVVCRDPAHSASTSHYGQDFSSSIQRENIYGVQFHPEKSHRHGMDLFRRFVEQ